VPEGGPKVPRSRRVVRHSNPENPLALTTGDTVDDGTADGSTADDGARRVGSAQGRLRSLLEASQAVVRLTELPQVLRRIAEVALELVGARYAALGVLAPDGHLEQFIHVGMDEADVAAIGHLPEGHGVLGALIADPHPIRLDRLGDDERSSGFPPGHPSMESFLGVPIRIRDEVFGNIYVTERTTGTFTEEDQELLTALAATAAIAIDNARLLEETRRRQRWSAAAAEVTAILVSDDIDDALGLIADRVVDLAAADLVAVVVRGPADALVVETARGSLADQLAGLVYPSAGTVTARAMESGQPILAADNTRTDSTANPWIALGPTMAIPFTDSGRLHGVLTVSRRQHTRLFTSNDLEMAADFAGQVSVALALARGRDDRTRLALLEERGRIARDLHDRVIQRLFAAGLGLQSLDVDPADVAVVAGIGTAARALDDSIAEIRTAIFALVNPTARDPDSLRHRIIDAVSEASAALPTSPRVVFSGPLDLLVPDSMTADIIAVVRESLANVAKHANASETLVSVTVDQGRVVVDVTDDGVGLQHRHHASGTANLARRAADLRGHFSLRDREAGGAELHWSATIPEAAEPRR